MTFVGLDVETTGTELGKSALVQIGIALPNITYVRDVRDPLVTTGEIVPDPEALKINGFTMGRIQKAQRIEEVDLILADRLKEDHGITEKSLIAVGWNVGGFDLPFIRRDMPRVSQFFHYRVVDLNSIVFLLAGNGPNYDRFKEQLKKEAETRVTSTAGWHDAGFDAEASLAAFQVLIEQHSLPRAA